MQVAPIKYNGSPTNLTISFLELMEQSSTCTGWEQWILDKREGVAATRGQWVMATFHLVSFNSTPSSSFTSLKWGWRKEKDSASMVANRTRGQPSRVLRVSGKGGSNKDVIMVDPVEAKRLAAKQMERVKAKEKLKRRRQIEAINGAWAMIGLTAGLVIEGQTGKSILTQLQDYLGAIVSLVVR